MINVDKTNVLHFALELNCVLREIKLSSVNYF